MSSAGQAVSSQKVINFRLKNGQCIHCGIQTHQVIKKPLRQPDLIPLNISGKVEHGRCLLYSCRRAGCQVIKDGNQRRSNKAAKTAAVAAATVAGVALTAVGVPFAGEVMASAAEAMFTAPSSSSSRAASSSSNSYNNSSSYSYNNSGAGYSSSYGSSGSTSSTRCPKGHYNQFVYPTSTDWTCDYCMKSISMNDQVHYCLTCNWVCCSYCMRVWFSFATMPPRRCDHGHSAFRAKIPYRLSNNFRCKICFESLKGGTEVYCCHTCPSKWTVCAKHGTSSSTTTSGTAAMSLGTTSLSRNDGVTTSRLSASAALDRTTLCPNGHSSEAVYPTSTTWTCDYCMKAIPTYQQVHYCQTCNWVCCKSSTCSSVAATPPMRCTHGHWAFRAKIPYRGGNSFYCDICFASLPGGTQVYCCHQCPAKWTVCLKHGPSASLKTGTATTSLTRNNPGASRLLAPSAPDYTTTGTSSFASTNRASTTPPSTTALSKRDPDATTSRPLAPTAPSYTRAGTSSTPRSAATPLGTKSSVKSSNYSRYPRLGLEDDRYLPRSSGDDLHLSSLTSGESTKKKRSTPTKAQATFSNPATTSKVTTRSRDGASGTCWRADWIG